MGHNQPNRNRRLLKEMKQAYRFYSEGDLDAFDIAIARIAESWMQDLKKLRRLIERFP